AARVGQTLGEDGHRVRAGIRVADGDRPAGAGEQARQGEGGMNGPDRVAAADGDRAGRAIDAGRRLPEGRDRDVLAELDDLGLMYAVADAGVDEEQSPAAPGAVARGALGAHAPATVVASGEVGVGVAGAALVDAVEDLDVGPGVGAGRGLDLDAVLRVAR